jgi:uncharacterized protein (DUF362 family)
MSKWPLLSVNPIIPNRLEKLFYGIGSVGRYCQFVKKNETILLKPNLITGANQKDR